MSNFFDSCTKLESLDLSKVETTQLVNMSSIFKNCISLKSLNLESFDTSNVQNFDCMFKGCSSLPILNLSGFRTFKGITINNMFNSCSSLKSLDISNFNTNTMSDYGDNVFTGCSSLNFINLYNYEGKDIFNNIAFFENLTYCARTEIEGTLKNNQVRLKCSKFYNDTITMKCYNYSIDSIEKDLCISCNINYYPKLDDNTNIVPYINCYKDLEGYYLDVNIYKPCYSTCKNCKGKGDINNHNCLECISDYILIDDKAHENSCYKKCPYKYYFDESNKYKCINKALINKTRDEIINNFDQLIIGKDQDQTHIISGEDYSIIIKPIDDYIEESTVNIDFTKCSSLLRKSIFQMNLE